MVFNTASVPTVNASSPSSSLQDLQKQPLWVWCGERVPKTQIVFFCQIFVVYCVIGVAIANFSLQTNSQTIVDHFAQQLHWLPSSQSVPKIFL